MSRPEQAIASRTSVFLWTGLWGLLVGVASVLPMILASSLVLVYGPHPAPDGALGSARLIALLGGAWGLLGGFYIGKYRTELGTAGLPLSPVLLSAGKWAAIWAGIAAVGVVSSRIFIRFPEDPPFNILNEVCVVTGAATLAGNLAAVLCILLKFEDDGQNPRSTGSPLGESSHPQPPPNAEGIQLPGKISDGQRP